MPADLEHHVDPQGIAQVALEYERMGDLVVEATEVERAKGRAFPTLNVSVLFKRRSQDIIFNVRTSTYLAPAVPTACRR